MEQPVPTSQRITNHRLYRTVDLGVTHLVLFASPVLELSYFLDVLPTLPPPGLILRIDLLAALFFSIDWLLNLRHQGWRYLRTPDSWINLLACVSLAAEWLLTVSGIANPRVLRLLRGYRAVLRLTLSSRGNRATTGVLGAQALPEMTNDDTWFALGILSLLSLIGQFPDDSHTGLSACLRELAAYLGFLALIRWKRNKNIQIMEKNIGAKLQRANRQVVNRMKEIPGLENVEHTFEEEAKTWPEKQHRVMNELDVMVSAVTLIMQNLQRFISRRTFLEAKGEQVLPRDQPVTLIFTDVEGFSTITEAMQEALLPVLARYLGTLHRVMAAHGGDIDKFIGDALFAYYFDAEAPWRSANSAFDSVLMILDQIDDLQRRPDWQALFDQPGWRTHSRFRTRFGLHLGTVIAGAVGSPERADSTLIGDDVNIAARVEALNKKYGSQVMMTESFFQALSPNRQRRCQRLDRVSVAGRGQPFQVYILPTEPHPPGYESAYQQGLEHYLKGDWNTAHAHFTRAAGLHPADRPVRAMLERIENTDAHWPTVSGYLDDVPDRESSETARSELDHQTEKTGYAAPRKWRETPWWQHEK